MLFCSFKYKYLLNIISLSNKFSKMHENFPTPMGNKNNFSAEADLGAREALPPFLG